MSNEHKQVTPVREAAKLLGRSKATIEQMMRDGALPFGTVYQRKSGGEYIYIIPTKALERYLNGELGGNACVWGGNDI